MNNIVVQLERIARGDVPCSVAQQLIDEWGPVLHALSLDQLNQQGLEPCPTCRNGPCAVRRMADCPRCGGTGVEAAEKGA